MLQYLIIPVTSFQQNCTLLWCDQTNDAVLIDPGGEADRLLTEVEKHHLNLKAIWLTHGHLDHIGATAELKQKLNLPVFGPHIDDQYLLNAIPLQCEMFGFSPVDSFVPDQWLEEGQTLEIGNESFSIIHTPGHTPGHIVLKHSKQKLLWVGDVLFRGAIGRTDFPRGNYDELINSIKSRLLPLDDAYRFIPGHGAESTIGAEKRNNPFLV